MVGKPLVCELDQRRLPAGGVDPGTPGLVRNSDGEGSVRIRLRLEYPETDQAIGERIANPRLPAPRLAPADAARVRRCLVATATSLAASPEAI